MNITAAVIVTTPQRLSFTDVVKGIDMFDTVNVPCVAVVENMAYADMAALDEQGSGEGAAAATAWARLRADVQEAVAAGGKGEGEEAVVERVLAAVQARLKGDRVAKPLFGKGHKQRLEDMWGLSNTVALPLLEEVSQSGDSGTPLVVGRPDSAPAQVFLDLAGRVVREVAKLRHDRSRLRPSVSYAPAEHAIVVTQGEERRQSVAPAALRRQCRCAMCVEEFTGRQLLRPEDVPESIKPVEIGVVGNYAVGVTWSDGHKSLFPYASFVEGWDGDKGPKRGKDAMAEAAGQAASPR